MFSCYAFVRMVQTSDERLKVLRTPGVLGFVGSEGQGTPIPDEQIESLKTAISRYVPCFPHPFPSAGKRVRIRGGFLQGVEGILVRQGADQSVVVSVELLQRSIAIRVEGYDIDIGLTFSELNHGGMNFYIASDLNPESIGGQENLK
jgi:transcription antitermination factor NusG